MKTHATKTAPKRLRYKPVADRRQGLLLPPTLEELVPEDSPARIIDLFVEGLDLAQMGFAKSQTARTGAKPFDPAMMLRLYLWGYLNKTRSSRQLEKACALHIEAMWLMRGLRPKYRAIAYFRAQNAKPFKQVFRQLLFLCRDMNLFDQELTAIDSTKLRAVNSKKNNFNEKKIKRHLAYIDKKVDEYFQQLDTNDRKEAATTGKSHQALTQLAQRRKEYERLQKQLAESGQPQISTTDSDSRHLVLRRNITEVAYNAQAAVEAKNRLVLDVEATNKNDTNALHKAAIAAKAALGKTEDDHIETLADKGYYNGHQIAQCEADNITTYVAPRTTTRTAGPVPTADYRADRFAYDAATDTYTCPEGHRMTSTGTVYTKHTGRDTQAKVKQYKTKACAQCPARDHCTTAKPPAGRIIERSRYAKAVEANNQRIADNPEKYQLRQSINEHIFGTIKRNWGYDHTLMKGLEKVNGELQLIFTCYNLRRIMSICGPAELKRRLKALFSPFLSLFHAHMRSRSPLTC